MACLPYLKIENEYSVDICRNSIITRLINRFLGSNVEMDDFKFYFKNKKQYKQVYLNEQQFNVASNVENVGSRHRRRRYCNIVK